MTEQVSPSRSTALFVGHPGHELRLYGWMRREKPICMVLTTGSRSGSDTARLQASSDLLTTLGGRPSELFGAVLDRDLYAAVLAGDTKPFLKWKATVVDVLIRNRPELLVYRWLAALLRDSRFGACDRTTCRRGSLAQTQLSGPSSSIRRRAACARWRRAKRFTRPRHHTFQKRTGG